MSQLVLNNGVMKRGVIQKILYRFTLGPYFLIGSMISLVVLVTVITLIFSTRQVTKGYVLNSLDTDHQELIKDMEKNDMLISRARSLSEIEESDKVKSMIKPRKVVFLEGDTVIAQK